MLAQQDTWQRAAEPASPQAGAQPGNGSPEAALAHGAAAAVGVSPDCAPGGGAPAPQSSGNAMQTELTDALVPAGGHPAAAVLVSHHLPHLHISRLQQ